MNDISLQRKESGELMNLQDKIKTIIENHRIGILSTIREGKPHSCFMIFQHDGHILYIGANEETQKIGDIRENKHVHVLLGYDGKGWNDNFLEIEATAVIEEDEAQKKKYWSEDLMKWVQNPVDPNYVLVKITPSKIAYIEKAGSEPEIITL
jgi:general stress protein 26